MMRRLQRHGSLNGIFPCFFVCSLVCLFLLCISFCCLFLLGEGGEGVCGGGGGGGGEGRRQRLHGTEMPILSY